MEALKRVKELNRAVFKLSISGPITPMTTMKIKNDLERFRIYTPVALAVVINSGGGSAAQSNIIKEELQYFAAKKHISIHCFAEDIALSGAYLILTSGSEVYSSESSLLGCIGSRMTIFEVKALAESYGIKRRQWSTSTKDLESRLDPLTSLTEESKKWAKEMLDQTTLTLQSLIEKGRQGKIKKDLAFTGDIFSGTRASEIGLIDGLGYCEEIMAKKFPGRSIIDISKRKFENYPRK